MWRWRISTTQTFHLASGGGYSTPATKECTPDVIRWKDLPSPDHTDGAARNDKLVCYQKLAEHRILNRESSLSDLLTILTTRIIATIKDQLRAVTVNISRASSVNLVVGYFSIMFFHPFFYLSAGIAFFLRVTSVALKSRSLPFKCCNNGPTTHLLHISEILITGCTKSPCVLYK